MEIKLNLKYCLKIYRAEVYVDQCKQLFEVTLRDGVVSEVYRVGANSHLSIPSDLFQLIKEQLKTYFNENPEFAN